MSKGAHITVIEEFFKKNPPGDGPVRLDQCTVINNPVKFVKSHLTSLKNNPGNRIMIPAYNRLYKFYKLSKTKNR